MIGHMKEHCEKQYNELKKDEKVFITITVVGKSMSAGRLYDRIGDEATAKVKYVLPQGLLCEVTKEE